MTRVKGLLTYLTLLRALASPFCSSYPILELFAHFRELGIILNQLDHLNLSFIHILEIKLEPP